MPSGYLCPSHRSRFLPHYDFGVTLLMAPLFVALGVLIVAGAAKVRTPSPTATALEALHIPQPLVIARVMGIAEIALGVAAAIWGTWWLYALVAAAYASFTVFIFWALNGNQEVGSCGCFGHEDTPPTAGHAAFNAAAAAIAGLATTNPVSIADLGDSAFDVIVSLVLVILAVVLCIAALTSLPRNLALVKGTAPAQAPTFALRDSAVQIPGNTNTAGTHK